MIGVGLSLYSGSKTLLQRAMDVLRSFPGSSSYPFATLQAAYQTSAGPAAASVNDPVGLELDAMWTVGAELLDIPNTGTGSGTWTVSGGVVTRNGSATGQATVTTAVVALLLSTKTYLVTVTATGVSGDPFGLRIGTSAAYGPVAADGVYEFRAPGGGTANIQFIPWGGSAGQATITVSCKEVTGNHASQPTAINRPTVQRGTWNLFLWSTSWANVVWQKISAPQDEAFQVVNGLTAGTKVTLSCVLSGSGTIKMGFFGAVLGLLDDTITLTATPTRYSKTITMAATEALNAYPYASRGVSTATGLVASDPQLEYGQVFTSYTPTWAAAGSNPTAGPYWAQGNGANQFMQLSSVPLSGTADHAMIACVNCNGTLNVQAVFEQTGTTAGIRFGVNTNTGYAYGEWTNDAGLTKTLSGSTDVRNQIIVITAVQRGNKRDVWLNNVQIATDTTAMGAFTFTSAWLLRAYGVLCWPGTVYGVDLVSGTITDEQLVVLGKAAAQRAGLTL